MSKILITGTCGFVFSNVVLYLLQHTKHDVVGIDKLARTGSILNAPEVKRYKLHIGDICDYHFTRKIFSIEKPDIVIHGASDPDDFVKTNVIGTHSVLEAALKAHTPKKFVNTSTYEVYGNIKTGQSKETDLLNPCNPYFSTKASSDLLGQSYFSTYGLPVLTTRCSNIFGPRQHKDKLISKIIMSAIKSEKVELGQNIDNIREWTYVKDYFYALLTLLENGGVGEVYNISSQYSKAVKSVVDMIHEIMGNNSVNYVKDSSIYAQRYALDCSKIKALGWEPKYKYRESLEYTVDWYRKNLHWFSKGSAGWPE